MMHLEMPEDPEVLTRKEEDDEEWEYGLWACTDD